MGEAETLAEAVADPDLTHEDGEINRRVKAVMDSEYREAGHGSLS